MIKKFAIGSQQMILDTATSGEAAFWKFLAKQTWEPGTFKTFDRFIGKNSVCLDIEGAEAAVLSEMRGYIAEQHPVMHISLHPYNLPEKRKALENIVGILGSYKYHYDERGRQVALPQYIKKMTGFISAKIKNIGSFSVTVTNTQW
jgi:hypothetical protein